MPNIIGPVVLDALLVTQFLVVLALFGLAGWLLYFDPTSRIRRAFALFLSIRAMIILTTQVARLDGVDPLFWSNLRGYFIIGQVPALANFFFVHVWRTKTSQLRVARWALLLLTASLELVYLAAHEALLYYNDEGFLLWGPLGILIGGVFTAGALVAIWFAFVADRTPVKAQVAFHRLLALGFASFGLVDGVLPWAHGPVLPEGFASAAAVGYFVYLAALPIGLVAIAWLVRSTMGEPHGRHRVAWILGIAAGSVVLPLVSAWWDPPGPYLGPLDPTDYLFHFVLGAARLMFPGLVAYAIARHTLSRADPFELDYRVKVAIRQSTVGAAFLAVFFILGEGAQDVFGGATLLEPLGQAGARIVGLLGAALLLLALHPLQRMAERVSSTALPHARPISELGHAERTRLYQEQASIAWADGTMTRKERLLLDRLRERLEIPVHDAARIEGKAARTD